jgi:hypothetical protein
MYPLSERFFYSAFVWKCTDKIKHRFGVQLLQNPPLCSSTEKYAFIPTVQYSTYQKTFKEWNSEGEGGEVERKGSMCAYMYEVAMGNLI